MVKGVHNLHVLVSTINSPKILVLNLNGESKLGEEPNPPWG
jgi:hypothetical protein